MYWRLKSRCNKSDSSHKRSFHVMFFIDEIHLYIFATYFLFITFQMVTAVSVVHVCGPSVKK